MPNRTDMQEKLAFIDGYLFRVMLELLITEGLEASGFYPYYERRVQEEQKALSWYDEELVGYITKSFDGEKRKSSTSASASAR